MAARTWRDAHAAGAYQMGLGSTSHVPGGRDWRRLCLEGARPYEHREVYEEQRMTGSMAALGTQRQRRFAIAPEGADVQDALSL